MSHVPLSEGRRPRRVLAVAGSAAAAARAERRRCPRPGGCDGGKGAFSAAISFVPGAQQSFLELIDCPFQVFVWKHVFVPWCSVCCLFPCASTCSRYPRFGSLFHCSLLGRMCRLVDAHKIHSLPIHDCATQSSTARTYIRGPADRLSWPLVLEPCSSRSLPPTAPPAGTSSTGPRLPSSSCRGKAEPHSSQPSTVSPTATTVELRQTAPVRWRP